MKDRFIQWFIFLINRDMQYFKEEPPQKKQMYERIKQMIKNEKGREKK